MVDQVHIYADLRKQIHVDLRIQHPEWVQADGESPVCDSYEDRLMELLAGLDRHETQSVLRSRSLSPATASDLSDLGLGHLAVARFICRVVKELAARRRNTRRRRLAVATS